MNIISILVVLYNKKLSDSETITSLLNLGRGIVNNLYIWNNGPFSIIEDDVCVKLRESIDSVVLINELSNRPLSHVYNLFIDRYQKSDYFVILDDDSILEANYLNIFELIKLESDINLILPKIIQNSLTYYPLKNLKPISNEDVLTKTNCRSIGSGLIFDKKLVAEYKKRFDGSVFDNRFALYGVDTSFFFRLAKIKVELVIKSLGCISHSLSRLEKPNKFRTYERAIDVALCARNYPSWMTYKVYIKFLIKSVIKNKDISLLILLLSNYFSGKHPKCK